MNRQARPVEVLFHSYISSLLFDVGMLLIVSFGLLFNLCLEVGKLPRLLVPLFNRVVEWFEDAQFLG